MSKKAAIKLIQTSGTRKTAVARLTMKPGTGEIIINNTPLERFAPRIAQMKIQEVCLFGSKVLSVNDLIISVHGGGVISQADAVRVAIGKALIEKDASLRETILAFDRQMLVADTRYKEPAKPNSHGAARAKRQKSYR